MSEAGKKEFNVTGIAEICRVVAVAHARRDLRRRQILRQEDIEMRELELNSETGYLTDFGMLVGGQLLDDIRAGEAFSPGLVRLRPVIRANTTVIVESDLFRAEGKALEEGRVGEYIKVQFPATKKVVVGRVIGPGKVRLGEKK